MGDFQDLIQKTRELEAKFPNRYDTRDHFMDLVEEVGELSQALQISSGRKTTTVVAKQRMQEDVVDALCDVLFELIRLSDKLGVDLEAEYLNVLNHIHDRIERGEFDVQKKG